MWGAPIFGDWPKDWLRGFDKADISRPFWELWLPTIHGVFACLFATWIHPCAKGMDILPVGVVLGDMVWHPKHPLSAQHQHAHATSLNVGARLLLQVQKLCWSRAVLSFSRQSMVSGATQETSRIAAAHVCLYLPLLARSICNYHVLQNIACVTFSRPKHCPPTLNFEVIPEFQQKYNPPAIVQWFPFVDPKYNPPIPKWSWINIGKAQL